MKTNSFIHTAIMGVAKRSLEDVKNITVQCVYCKKLSGITNWSFIQDMWYTQPHGCMGGDYWNEREFEACHIQCPECKTENYIFTHPQRKDLEETKEQFSLSVIFKSGVKKYKYEGMREPDLKPLF